MSYLLSISVGPVQEFIAAARKTRDLWSGSEMLSEVSREVAKSLKAQGCKLIFPDGNSAEKANVSIANKLLVIVPDGKDVKTVVENARDAAHKYINDKLNDSLRGFNNNIDVDKCKKQVSDFIEFYAAWFPFKEGQDDIDTVRTEVERLLAGRKALRDFKPAVSSEGVPKSSLDAGRDSVIRANDLKDHERRKYGIKKGEMLDAISLIKRIGDVKRFVSTARVAADPFVRRLKHDSAKDLDELRALAKGLDSEDSNLCRNFKGNEQYNDFPYDTQLFFDDAVTDSDEDEDTKDIGEKFIKKVKEICKHLDLPELLPYYAILVADGDGMGVKIGEVAKAKGHQGLTYFSGQLSAFSLAAKEIVENQNHGALIYGGGDDVLALLPLDTALSCADALRNQFQQDTQGTMSVGVAIVHVTAHLQTAIGWARDAEQDAKSFRGKNALSVHLHTRTAGDDFIRSTNSWNDAPVEKRWNIWRKLLISGQMPLQAPYHLRQLAQEFIGIEEPDVLQKEVERILKRKRADGGSKEMSAETIEKIKEVLVPQNTTITLDSLNSLVNEMIISKHFAGAVKIAPQDTLGGER